MNDLTTGGGISESLKRRYGISDERPVATLATDLFPMVNVADGVIPDLAWTAGVRLCSGYVNVTAVAAEYQGLWLRNPTGSNTLAVVRPGGMTTAGAEQFLRIYYDDPGTVGTASAFTAIVDARAGVSAAVRQSPSLQVRGFSTATPGGTLCGYVRQFVPMDLPMVLLPGTAMSVVNIAVNTTFTGFVKWTERALNLWEAQRAF